MNFIEVAQQFGPNAKYQVQHVHDVNPLSQRQKVRLIFRPNKAMKVLQGMLDQYVKNLLLRVHYSIRRLVAASPYKLLAYHAQNRWWYHLDLSSAYDYVKLDKLSRLIKDIDSDQEYESILSFLKLFSFDPDRGLIRGAHASPRLFQIYLHHYLDIPFRELVRQYGFRYSRYGDDLLFSSRYRIGKVKQHKINEVIRSAGFFVNVRESQYLVDTKWRSITVCGLTCYQGRIRIPRRALEMINKKLHRALFADFPEEKMKYIVGTVSLVKYLTRKRVSPQSHLERRILKKFGQLKMLTQKSS